MRNTKTWNYAAVTKEAERRITDLMTQSHQQSEPKEAALLRHWGLWRVCLMG